MTALLRTATVRDYVILATSDAQLVRKLHAMRASQATFEHQGARWIITRIMLLPASSTHPNPGCGYGQGYLLGRPRLASDVVAAGRQVQSRSLFG